MFFANCWSQFDERSFQFYDNKIKRDKIDSAVIMVINYCDSINLKYNLDAKIIYTVVLYYPDSFKIDKKWKRFSKKVFRRASRITNGLIYYDISHVSMDLTKIEAPYVSFVPALKSN